MPGTITIPLTCPKCRNDMSVAVRSPPLDGDRQRKPQVVRCPYPQCDYEMRPELYGVVVAVWAGHGSRPV